MSAMPITPDSLHRHQRTRTPKISSTMTKVVNRLGNEAASNKGFSQAHFIGNQKATLVVTESHPPSPKARKCS